MYTCVHITINDPFPVPFRCQHFNNAEFMFTQLPNLKFNVYYYMNTITLSGEFSR